MPVCDLAQSVKVDHSSPVPLSVQIRDSLTELIESGVLAPGARLPSVRVLSDSLGVSHGTVQKAVLLLKRDGRAVGRVGRGVFVRGEDDARTRTRIYLCLHPHALHASQGVSSLRLKGVLRAAHDRDVDLRLITNEKDAMSGDLQRPGVGVLFFGGRSQGDGYGRLAEFVCAYDIPACTPVDSASGLPCVRGNYDVCLDIATEHLLGYGHRRIGVISHPTDWAERSKINREGYAEALQRNGISPDPALYIEARPSDNASPEHTSRALDELLALSPPPTAIICDSDRRAGIVMGLLGKRGIRVPDDLSLIACEESPENASLTPPLTVVDPKVAERGEAVLLLLLDLVADRLPEDPGIQPELILRASTRQLDD
jgi:DNA-binding LacI/PurR family transcriptional regulator